jgi:hypothetical protein
VEGLLFLVSEGRGWEWLGERRTAEEDSERVVKMLGGARVNYMTALQLLCFWVEELGDAFVTASTVAPVGRVRAGGGVRCRDADGADHTLPDAERVGP